MEQHPISKDQWRWCPKPSRKTHIPFPGWWRGTGAGSRAGMRRGREKCPLGAWMAPQLLKALKRATAPQPVTPHCHHSTPVPTCNPSLYFPFPILPSYGQRLLSVHPAAPSKPQLLPLRGLQHFTCCMICPERAATCMWVGDGGNLLVNCSNCLQTSSVIFTFL